MVLNSSVCQVLVVKDDCSAVVLGVSHAVTDPLDEAEAGESRTTKRAATSALHRHKMALGLLILVWVSLLGAGHDRSALLDHLTGWLTMRSAEYSRSGTHLTRSDCRCL
jgi:hypothetical protein